MEQNSGQGEGQTGSDTQALFEHAADLLFPHRERSRGTVGDFMPLTEQERLEHLDRLERRLDGNGT